MKSWIQGQWRRIKTTKLRESSNNFDSTILGGTTPISLPTDWRDEMKPEGKRTRFLSTMRKDNYLMIMMCLKGSAIASTRNVLDASGLVKSVEVVCAELFVKLTGNSSLSKPRNKELEDKSLKIPKLARLWWKNSNLVSIVGAKVKQNLIDLFVVKLFRVNKHDYVNLFMFYGYFVQIICGE